jgi:hypothetical protein
VPAPSGFISNITAASGKAYQAVTNGLVSGAGVYTDRDYTFTTVPSSLNKATYIKTANDDKSQTSTTFLRFTTNQNTTVYVAYDIRATSLPAWLSSWTNAGITLGTTDTNLRLYSKGFPAGTVTLGGNAATIEDSSMYSVIVVPGANSTSSTNFIPGDFLDAQGNRDGKVDAADVSRLLTLWGKTDSASLQIGDISGPAGVPDGKINIYDANKLMANWSR